MDHDLEIERRTREDLLRIARALDLPLLATNDLHYTHAADAQAHEVLLCVQTGKTLADPNRFKFDAQDFYLKSAAEMRHVWRELPEACDNTLLVAERCSISFNEGANLMPRFPVPEGESEESWLVKEVELGLHQALPPRQSPTPTARRPTTSSASSARWASRATSSSWPTSSATPTRAASGSVRVAARRPDRSSPTPWASPSSTRSSTGCCSSASSTPSASRCPTSTWTSTSAAAAT